MKALGTIPLLLMAIASAENEWVHLGEPFTIDRETPIQGLIEHPGQYHSMDVKTSGIIASVCDEDGSFIEVVPKDGRGEGILVNFPGLTHTFPLDCAGRDVVVEGLFYQKVYPSSRISPRLLAQSLCGRWRSGCVVAGDGMRSQPAPGVDATAEARRDATAMTAPVACGRWAAET
jgi:hypothetical protein